MPIRTLTIARLAATALAAAPAASASAAPAAPRTTELVSLDGAGRQANGFSFHPSPSGDGRFVAFVSNAASLGGDHLYLRDRAAGTTTIVDRTSSGALANTGPQSLRIARDGRHVAFSSSATNLVPGDRNEQIDVFVRDVRAGTTTRVNVTSAGGQAIGGGSEVEAISADGRYVAFLSEAPNLTGAPAGYQPFVHDLRTGKTTLESRGLGGARADADSSIASLSGDGRYIVFESRADNLVEGDRNGEADVFLRDRREDRTVLVSVAADGSQGNRSSFGGYVSDDGGVVAFTSLANNLDRGAPQARKSKTYVRDMRAGTTTRIDVARGGGVPDDQSGAAGISADGRYVLFVSYASNIVAGDADGAPDAFVYDRRTGAVTCASVSAPGPATPRGVANQQDAAALSADGRVVAFGSLSPAIVPRDRNGAEDVFVRLLGGAGASASGR